ncbi:hypothetical protein GCM10010246_77900 [Streptomyces cuspidosporus]|uniref:Uncharacterized protein n=1 Tax=Streptomyces cuspidosporus TaxID=66882 RepID=A0ABN3H9P5_9ACTN
MGRVGGRSGGWGGCDIALTSYAGPRTDRPPPAFQKAVPPGKERFGRGSRCANGIRAGNLSITRRRGAPTVARPSARAARAFRALRREPPRGAAGVSKTPEGEGKCVRAAYAALPSGVREVPDSGGGGTGLPLWRAW